MTGIVKSCNGFQLSDYKLKQMVWKQRGSSIICPDNALVGWHEKDSKFVAEMTGIYDDTSRVPISCTCRDAKGTEWKIDISPATLMSSEVVASYKLPCEQEIVQFFATLLSSPANKNSANEAIEDCEKWIVWQVGFVAFQIAVQDTESGWFWSRLFGSSTRKEDIQKMYHWEYRQPPVTISPDRFREVLTKSLGDNQEMIDFICNAFAEHPGTSLPPRPITDPS